MAKKKEAETYKVEATKKMYEAMLLLKPDMLESGLKKKLKDFKEYLEEHDCNVIEEDIWEKRRLAYKIKQYDEAVYVVYNFEGPTTLINNIENHLRLDVDIIRHLIITIPEGYKYIKFREEAEEIKEEKRPKKSIKKEVIIEKPVKKEREPDKIITEPEKKEKPSSETDESETEKKEPLSKLKILEEKEKEDSKDSKKKEDSEKINKSDLDDKLDKLLGGDDLNI